MHSTRASHSLKKLFAGYHEPVPLSKERSRNLLQGLKLSFRDQLEREYGRSPSSSSSVAPAVSKSDHPITPRRSAANQHLRTLLSNPLFSYQNVDNHSVSPASTPPKRDPMDVFDHAVSRGMMTLKAATGCLVAKNQQMTADSQISIDMPGTDTALRVIRWLRSSRPDNDLGFLDNKVFIRNLMPFLVSEGLDHVAWEWLSRTIDDISHASNETTRQRRASVLLAVLVRAKTRPQHDNLDAAITTLLQAEQSFQSNPMTAKIMLQPWRLVSWLATVESYRNVSWLSTVELYRKTAPSERLFDAHVEAAHRLNTPVEIEKAHLHLFHPTHPDHKPALRLFEDMQKVRNLLKAIASEKIGGDMELSQWTAILGQDTINFLKRSGNSREAQHVTDLLQSEMAILFPRSLEPA